MTKDDYEFVSGDIDKIELGGALLPQRYEEHKTKSAILEEFGADITGGVALKGEDLVFLMESLTRLGRVGVKAKPPKSAFSRIISAVQASSVINSVADLFNGRFLRSLPEAGSCRKLKDNEIDTFVFDTLTSSDMEAMTPLPAVGEKVCIDPFLAAYKNLKKVEGKFGEAYGAISAVAPVTQVLWNIDSNISGSTLATTQTLFQTEASYSLSGRENDIEHFYGYAVASGPNIPTATRWKPTGESDHAFVGLRIMSATVYTVSAGIYEISNPPLSGGEGTVIRNDGWAGNVVLFGGWTTTPAYIQNYFVVFNQWESLLSKCCSAIGAPWSEIRADVSNYRGGHIIKYATATPAKQFYIATTDDCIKAAL